MFNRLSVSSHSCAMDTVCFPRSSYTVVIFICTFFSVDHRKPRRILRGLNAFARVSYRLVSLRYTPSWREKFLFLNFQSLYVLELSEVIIVHAPSTVYTFRTHAIRCREAYCRPSYRYFHKFVEFGNFQARLSRLHGSYERASSFDGRYRGK